MRPPLWHPPVELSLAEHAIIKRIRRAKLCIFLRQHRHTLFAEPLQQELSKLYKDQPQGHPPVPPAQRALATVLQASTQVSDDEGIEATTMDRRWQLVLDCLDCDTPPFSTGTLVVFRQRLIAQEMAHRLLELTVEIAATSAAFGPRQLRAALDSSPPWGAGRVEDTYNLLGHALRKALGVVARQQGRGLRAVAKEARATLVAKPSLTAALDLDWDHPTAQPHALTRVLDVLSAVEHWLDAQPVPRGDHCPCGRQSGGGATGVRPRPHHDARGHTDHAPRRGRRAVHSCGRCGDAPRSSESESARRWL